MATRWSDEDIAASLNWMGDAFRPVKDQDRTPCQPAAESAWDPCLSFCGEERRVADHLTGFLPNSAEPFQDGIVGFDFPGGVIEHA